MFVLAELDHIVSIEGDTNPLIVGNYSILICVVICDFIPSIQWTDPDRNQVTTYGDSVNVGEQFTDGNMTYLYLSFDPLKLSHGGMYSCESTVQDPPSSNVANRNIVVQSKLRIKNILLIFLMANFKIFY